MTNKTEVRDGYWVSGELASGLRLGSHVTVIGERYMADGWSSTMALFRFRPVYGDGAPTLEEQADFLRVRGVDGAATHGCERIGGIV